MRRLTPLTLSTPKHVYQAITPRLKARSQAYFEAYPDDLPIVTKILTLLKEKPYLLPDSGLFTAERFRDTGIILGTTHGFEKMHALLSQAFTDRSEQQLRWAFVEAFRQHTDYESHPLYCLLHEAIYCQHTASEWAAYQVITEDPEFQHLHTTPMFWGETIRPQMLAEYTQLRGFSQVAAKLAEYLDWPALYDLDALANNTVAVQCIVYEQDYYVDFNQSLATANAIGNCALWCHPEWQHDAIRAHGEQLIPELLARFFTLKDTLK